MIAVMMSADDKIEIRDFLRIYRRGHQAIMRISRGAIFLLETIGKIGINKNAQT